MTVAAERLAVAARPYDRKKDGKSAGKAYEPRTRRGCEEKVSV
jgi:hypothetical protein